MRTNLGLLALLFTFGCDSPGNAAIAPPSTPPTAAAPRAGDRAARATIHVDYGAASTPTHTQLRQQLAEQRVLENVASEIAKHFKLPRPMHLRLASCGTINAFYNSTNAEIVMCYELLEHAAATLMNTPGIDIELAFGGMFLFVFGHELGHALHHELGLPITGRGEDAADQFSMMLAIVSKDEQIMSGALIGAAYIAGTSNAPYWDEHSTGPTRFVEVACLLYGANPVEAKTLVDAGFLPAERAPRCARQYREVDSAWRTLLRGHLHDEAAFWAPLAKS